MSSVTSPRHDLDQCHAFAFGCRSPWLATRGYLPEPDASNAPPEPSVAEALTAAGSQQGTLVTLREDGEAAQREEPHVHTHGAPG